MSSSDRELPDVDPSTVAAHQSTFFWKCGKFVCRIATTLCFDLKVWNADLIPNRGGVLLVSNHQSYLDPVLLGVKLRRPISYMAKSELFTNPWFSWLIRNLHAFPVRQGAGDISAMKEAIKRLHAGHVLNIFPEGSRTETGEMLPIQPGAALLVRRAGVPVMPVAIDGSFQSWPKFRKFPHCHPIRMLYGAPERLDHLKPPEIVKWIDQRLHQLLEELRNK